VPNCSFVLQAARDTVRHLVKDRLITTGLALAALLLLICSVGWAHTTVEASLNMRPWAHMTLEASLNLLWLLLAASAFAQWGVSDNSRRSTHLSGLVTLVFAVSLLFPVISASDDLAQMQLINDARTSQSTITNIKCDKKLPASAGLLSSPAALPVQLASFAPAALGFVFEPGRAANVASPGGATGNHSPPLN
jgi:hypothetical protein